MSKIIKFDNVSYSYSSVADEETTEALKNISVEIEKGEFVSVVGHNGSGKSTFAKHINALLLPTSGKVTVNDLDTAKDENLWNVRQSAGMVFQNPDNQIVATIVEEDVAFGPENLGIERSEIRRRVDMALGSVEMSEYAGKAPHMLSGGQKQRVAIAGVIAMHPDIVIMDEPTAMLDPMGRREVMNAAKNLHSEGVTVILITHFMDEAAQTERIIVMDEGEIAMDGNPQDVFKHHKELTALDLDVPPMIKLANGLSEQGIKITAKSEIEDTAEELCQLFLKN